MVVQNNVLMADFGAFKTFRTAARSATSLQVANSNYDKLCIEIRETLHTFVHHEIALGMTFAEFARASADTRKRERNMANAQTAFRTAAQFIQNPLLNEEQRSNLQRELEAFESKLNEIINLPASV